ncbi:MAG: CRISPR-associated protein Cas4 [Synergistales bacterium]|nr:CRISPR-associated protein Cas4 [Synergistales bacterium]
MHSEDERIGGTLVWYASICERQVWLMSRGVEPDRRDELLAMGRLIDEESYSRERGVAHGGNAIDILNQEDDRVVVAEVKKSSASREAALLQLAHYLYQLERDGIVAEGELRFPRERRKERLSLDDTLRTRLDGLYRRIHEICAMDKPPERKRTKYCRRCAYAEWCWG